MAALRYAGTATGVVCIATAGLWPFLDPAAWRGVVVAALVALPTQIVAFWLLESYRERLNAFLAVWIGGTLIRMAVVGAVAVAVIRSGVEGGAAMLLALAGFFFALLLLEPLYFAPEPTETTR